MMPHACARALLLGLGLGLLLASGLFALARGASAPALSIAGMGSLALILATCPRHTPAPGGPTA